MRQKLHFIDKKMLINTHLRLVIAHVIAGVASWHHQLESGQNCPTLKPNLPESIAFIDPTSQEMILFPPYLFYSRLFLLIENLYISCPHNCHFQSSCPVSVPFNLSLEKIRYYVYTFPNLFCKVDPPLPFFPSLSFSFPSDLVV